MEAETSRDAGDHARRIRELDRANRRHRSRRYRSLVLRWLRTSLGRPRPVPVEPLPPVSAAQVSLTFVGHATVLVRYAGLGILTDPMLGSRLGIIRRALAPGIRDDALADVDIVLISNPDPAHLHLPSLARLPRRATVVVPTGMAGRLAALGFDRVLELAPDQSFGMHGCDIHTTPVRADGGMGFVIRGNGPTLFFCGRSGYCRSFYEVGQTHRPDLALLPIGGYLPASFRERHLSPLDALYAFEDLRARLLVPIHFGSFALSYERLGEPPRWLADLVAERNLEDFVIPLAPGESRLFTNPGRARRPTPHIGSDGDELVLGPAGRSELAG